MRLSVSDKYRPVYRLATQGAQNSVPSSRGGFRGLSPPYKASTPKFKCETLESSAVFIQGRSQDFSKGGAEIMEAKAL